MNAFKALFQEESLLAEALKGLGAKTKQSFLRPPYDSKKKHEFFKKPWRARENQKDSLPRRENKGGLAL